MIKVYNAKDTTEAQIIKGMLEAYGIEAYVGGQYLQGGVGDLAAMDFSTISVVDKDADKARELVGKYERDELG
jgi:Putative prokaryotic signal transducing protein